MKIEKLNILLLVTVLFIGLLLGCFIGRNVSGPQILVNPGFSESPATVTSPPTTFPLSTEISTGVTFPLNINTATKQMLIELPGIGEVLAGRIIEYRESFGDFATLEELMEVSGISQKKFDALSGLITLTD